MDTNLTQEERIDQAVGDEVVRTPVEPVVPAFENTPAEVVDAPAEPIFPIIDVPFVKPVRKVKVERVKKIVEVPVEEAPDRRHFNCIPCGGDGLVKNGWKVDEVCPSCQGTGKVGQ
jgi:hypothetical protein